VLEGTLSGDTYTTTAKYLWEGESYYSPLISEYVSNAWRHYLYDGLGSTRQLLDANQTVTDTYTYEAFGTSKGSTGSTPNPYRYVGSLGYYQTGSSLMHLGARYYLPEAGRFMGRDPLRHLAGLNMYWYAMGNPGNATDPSGLWCWHIPDLRGGVSGCIGTTCHGDPRCPSAKKCPSRCGGNGEGTNANDFWERFKHAVETGLPYAVPGSEFVTAAGGMPEGAWLAILKRLSALREYYAGDGQLDTAEKIEKFRELAIHEHNRHRCE
jgi:RHS repeat-associated protein